MQVETPRFVHPPSISTMVVVAAAYCVTGRLGLLLAIPPGYATAIWPPSGIALAVVLLCGYRVVPGIILGSFLVNMWVAFDATTVAAMLQSVVLATSISLGAALQATVGAVMIRRCVGFPCPLDQEKDVGLFLFLGGPISCLVNATIGVSSLWIGGVLPGAMALFSWWTWWVGDSLGVLIVTPLVLIWTAEPRQGWRRRRIALAVPLGVVFTVTTVFFIYTSGWDRDRIQLAFAQQASSLGHTLANSFEGYLEVLHAIESFYASSREVDAHEFRAFVQGDLSRHVGIQALEWIPLVPDAERARYEAAMRQAGYQDFQITQREAQGQMARAARRDAYFPVTYVEPYETNKLALGFDLASNPARLEALRQARDTGEPVATARITLVQETGRQFGFLIFLPIYRNGLPHTTVEERRRNLHGFTLGVFRIGDIVESSLHLFDQKGIELALYDQMAPAGQRVLYGRQGWAQKEAGTATAAVDKENPVGMQWETTLTFAGREWLLRFTPTLDYLTARQTWQPWAVMAGGLLFTGMLGAFLLVVTGRTTSIEQLVTERTAELSRANTALEHEITERKQAEAALTRQARELFQANAELERSNKELDDFAYIASHDLKEPLRGIHNYSTFLLEDYADKLDDEGRDKLTTLTRLTQRMETLINSLLYYSRVGRVDLAIDDIDLNTMVAEVIDSLAIPLQEAGVETRFPAPLPTMRCDQVRVGEVFRNLITNAMKYNDKPQKWIEIGCIEDLQHGTPPVLYVRDNGIGIREKHHEAIFRIFKRLHGRDKYHGGTGAGLTIVKKIIERHGGHIWVESVHGDGTTFYFTLNDKEEA